MTPFETVLIANRGEVACRVARAARLAGLRTVAVYTGPDRGALHTRLADEAIDLGDDPRGYLDPDALLGAAARAGADAVHPGYGFLSENADFAEAVARGGRVWIGPPAAAIAAMGDKARAKRHMRAAGVPVIPGWEGTDTSEDALLDAARELGFPVLVKATAGGGGRGMRRVDSADRLLEAVYAAREEAERAFGDGTILLERLVVGARHIEVQVAADRHGAIVHLGERDCSTQRRHQKVIEEAPAPGVDAALRSAMGAAACAAARAVGYENIGTVELLLAPDGAWWFLEMNTRLQVEHPVTELVTGVDLVALQLRLAMGHPLPLRQDDVVLRGHAIEARLYAEDPAAGHAPRTGTLRYFRPPDAVRTDHGLAAPTEIGADYDPLLAKVVAHGADREAARLGLRRALERCVVLGPPNNRAFLHRALGHPAFVSGGVDNGFLEREVGLASPPATNVRTRVAAAWAWLARHTTGDGFRSSHVAPLPVELEIDGARVDIGFEPRPGGARVWCEGEPHDVRATTVDATLTRLCVDGRDFDVWAAEDGDDVLVQVELVTHRVRRFERARTTLAARASDVRAPMAGTVRRVLVAVGEAVDAGQVLVVIEAMKIETPLRAPGPGVVREVRAVVGVSVASGTVLVTTEPR